MGEPTATDNLLALHLAGGAAGLSAISFGNFSGREMTVLVEPWGETYEMPDGVQDVVLFQESPGLPRSSLDNPQISAVKDYLMIAISSRTERIQVFRDDQLIWEM